MNAEDLTLQTGRNITAANDPLSKLSIAQLFGAVSNPDPALQSRVEQLRTVQSIDPKRYQALKKLLPYITCGIFNPPYRRTENFASIQCFILDIDHLGAKDIDITRLREKLKTDPRIALMFVSPGNDGLKLLFRLEQKCFDAGKYSLFYKLFATRFANEYALGQAIDKVTSDVTRACFMSTDAEAWINENALPVDMDACIDFENQGSVQRVQSEIKEHEAALREKGIVAEKPSNQELPPDLLRDIREKLNPNIKTRREKQIFVPEELNRVISVVEARMTELGIAIKSVESIHYGKKIVFELGTHWAQLNLFYGKQGYKVVKTPVNGSNAELADIAFIILCELFY